MNARLDVQNLDLIATAPQGVKRLRELILELAVRGKLVPQDPNDKPASELLKRIQAEKARLVAEGKIKKDKSLPVIGEDEKPFELPVGWEWVRLGQVSDANTGHAFKSSEYIGSGTFVLRVTNIKPDGLLDLSDAKYIDPVQAVEHYSSVQLAKGDVLLVMVGGSLGKIGVVNKECLPAVLNQNMWRMSRFGAMPVEFLIYGLKLINSTQLKITHSTHGHLAQGEYLSKLFPLPPLPEQHRIVAKVDELMALCDRLESQQDDAASAHTTLVKTLLDTLTLQNHLLGHSSAQRPDRSGRPVRSAPVPGAGHDQIPISPSQSANDFAANWQRLAQHFDTLFTTEASIAALKQTLLQLAVMGKLVPQDPNDEPASELLKRIQAEKTRLVVEGKIKKDKPLPEIGEDEKPFELPVGWEWIRFNELTDPQSPISYGVLVPGPDEPSGIPFVRLGDLDIENPPEKPAKSISSEVDKQYERTRLHGGEILMGVVGSIGKLGIAPASWKGANIARAVCRINPVKPLNHRFIVRLLQSGFMQESFIGDTRTLAQPTLNVGLIREVLTPLPPLPEQHRIVAKVDELMALCDHLASRLKAAREISARYAATATEALLEAA